MQGQDTGETEIFQVYKPQTQNRGLRYFAADERAFLTALSHLSIDVEEINSAVVVIRDGTAAAMRYGLTAYDAAYVDLSAQEGLTLATSTRQCVKPLSNHELRFFRSRELKYPS